MQVCLDPKYARYINLASELQAYLAERYGKGLDFGVKHQNDRWYFTLPGNQEMTEKQLKYVDPPPPG
ncbi:hypothetical protein F4779DRAFT_617337 [Xylariaceae sp. FL0662B]|nr:hypothetical protein F4779DRAFT_617337 [Xylariaceae sp. FL0662B]